jgi:hypothetical protein
VLNYIPNERINDVMIFDPGDRDNPVAFNLLEDVEDDYKPIVVSGIVAIFHKLWAESWGPRLEHILRYTFLALLYYPGSTFLSVPRMLSDDDFRAKVLEKVTDPVVKDFWESEFAGYPDRTRQEAIMPIQNKIGQFLASSTIRNIVGQPKSAMNIRQIMDEKKILLVKVSKGVIGEDNSALMGAMMITKLQLAAMSRANTPVEERVPFNLYVDEFQNFATESFASILSEARKYNLNLHVANQYIEQMSEMVREAVFGNVGTLITFRVGATDADYLAKEFAPTFAAEDLVNLEKFNIYLRMTIDGISSMPFSATTLPLPQDKTSTREKIMLVSRERYGTEREFVEGKIKEWSDALTKGKSTREKGRGRGKGKGRPQPNEPVQLSEEEKARQSQLLGKLNAWQVERKEKSGTDVKTEAFDPAAVAEKIRAAKEKIAREKAKKTEENIQSAPALNERRTSQNWGNKNIRPATQSAQPNPKISSPSSPQIIRRAESNKDINYKLADIQKKPVVVSSPVSQPKINKSKTNIGEITIDSSGEVTEIEPDDKKMDFMR